MYFDGNAPKEPGTESPHEAAVRLIVRGVVDDQPKPTQAEDEMVSYLDAKRAYERVEAKVDACSDATLGVIAAWFAASEKDRHRVINDDVLRRACEEFASK